MADPDIPEIDRPRGKVMELVITLRALGLGDVADIIVSDILFRNRTRLRRGRFAEGKPAEEAPHQEGSDDEDDQFENGDVTPLETESTTPLSDEEQVTVALRAIELGVVNPLQMLDEVSLLTAEIDAAARNGAKPSGLSHRTIPLLQLGPDRQPIRWSDDETTKLAGELQERLGQLALWLRSSS